MSAGPDGSSRITNPCRTTLLYSGCQQTRDLSLFIFAQVSTTAAWRSWISVLTDGGGHQAAELGCSRMAAGVLRSAPRQRGRKYADGGCGSAERRAGRDPLRPRETKIKSGCHFLVLHKSLLLAPSSGKIPLDHGAYLVFWFFLCEGVTGGLSFVGRAIDMKRSENRIVFGPTPFIRL